MLCRITNLEINENQGIFLKNASFLYKLSSLVYEKTKNSTQIIKNLIEKIDSTTSLTYVKEITYGNDLLLIIKIQTDKESHFITACRGSDDLWDWISNIMFIPQKCYLQNNKWGRAHGDFYETLKNVSDELNKDIRLYMDEVTSLEKNIWFTGHSRGGALSLLCTANLPREYEGNLSGVYTFGQPPIGNKHFVKNYDQRYKQKTFRIANSFDPVSGLAGIVGYRHTEGFCNNETGSFRREPNQSILSTLVQYIGLMLACCLVLTFIVVGFLIEAPILIHIFKDIPPSFIKTFVFLSLFFGGIIFVITVVQSHLTKEYFKKLTKSWEVELENTKCNAEKKKYLQFIMRLNKQTPHIVHCKSLIHKYFTSDSVDYKELTADLHDCENENISYVSANYTNTEQQFQNSSIENQLVIEYTKLKKGLFWNRWKKICFILSSLLFLLLFLEHYNMAGRASKELEKLPDKIKGEISKKQRIEDNIRRGYITHREKEWKMRNIKYRIENLEYSYNYFRRVKKEFSVNILLSILFCVFCYLIFYYLLGFILNFFIKFFFKK